jgi:hypothetical protein
MIAWFEMLEIGVLVLVGGLLLFRQAVLFRKQFR